jgi:hypothetical protein
MTREPLMLSDTAMVLLQEYVEIKNHKTNMLKAALQEIFPQIASFQEASGLFLALIPEEREKLMTRIVQRLQEDLSVQRELDVEFELVQEIWTLWTSPDLTPIRLLDWHLAFDAELMMLAEIYLVARPEHPRRRSAPVVIVNPWEPLLDRLRATYQTELAKRNQDHS